jgi:drug/metabolite transporter (DMT)-like permease
MLVWGMVNNKTISLTSLAMLAFAGNSILCRLALKTTTIDAASFTSIRLASAGAMLWAILPFRGQGRHILGSWPSAVALFAYAAGFSFAYINLKAGTGALLLFGSVQTSMISFGLWRGERFNALQIVGFISAIIGLIVLVFPGLSAPPIASSALMIFAGMAWGIYSLRGRGAGDPIMMTAGNFIRTLPLAAILSLAAWDQMQLDQTGVVLAIASGAITSGIGYAIWYSALPSLKATEAATVQLSVPVIAAIGGILLIGEPLSLRIVLASMAILAGVTLVIYVKSPTNTKKVQ